MQPFLLNHSQKQQVINQTYHYIDLANKLLEINMPTISIKFDLKGRASGMFVVKNRDICIRYNEIIFSKYFDDSLINTVAHEVAHYVVHSTYGIKRVKPHGKEWKHVMTLFEVKPEVTSNYEVSELPLHRQSQHEYICGCMSHQLSKTRHNRVQRKLAVYKCKKCLQPLSSTN